MPTPPDDVAAIRAHLRDPGALLTEVRARVSTLMSFHAIKTEQPLPTTAIRNAVLHTQPVLTAYHELLRDAGMVIVTREKWDRLNGYTDDDWDE